MWFDFSFSMPLPITHTHTRTHSHTVPHMPASGLCQAPRVKCWLEIHGVIMSREFCSSVPEKIPALEILSMLPQNQGESFGSAQGKKNGSRGEASLQER